MHMETMRRLKVVSALVIASGIVALTSPKVVDATQAGCPDVTDCIAFCGTRENQGERCLALGRPGTNCRLNWFSCHVDTLICNSGESILTCDWYCPAGFKCIRTD